MSTVETIFYSVPEMQEFLRETPVNEGMGGYVSTANPAEEWSGNLTLDESIAKASIGWAEMRQDADAIASGIAADVLKTTPTLRPAFQLGFAGSTVDMGRFISGHPQHMVDFTMAASDANERVCVLLVGICVSSGVRPETLVKRGAAIVALIDILAQTGRSVEVWIEATTKSGKYHAAAVRVKAASESLDLDMLMFAIAHPASFRRNMFGVWERNGDFTNQTGGYGRAMEIVLAERLGATVSLTPTNGNNPPEVTAPVDWILGIVEQVESSERVHAKGDTKFRG